MINYSSPDGPVPVVPLNGTGLGVFMATNVHDGEVIRGFGLSEEDALAVCLNHTEMYRLSRRSLALDKGPSDV